MHHRLLLLALIINTAETNHLCVPGELRKPYTFISNFSQSPPFLTWIKSGTNIVLCNKSDCHTLIQANEYIYKAEISSQSSILTIKNITTESSGNYSYQPVTNWSKCFSCSLKVYAKPDIVTCQDPEFQTDTNDVAVVCTVLGVYPNPVCQFSWFIDTKESYIIQENVVEYKNVTGSRDPSYFNQNCSFKVPARNFTHGIHQFQLLAYPDVTGQDNDTVYGENSSQTSPKYVADPLITLECSVETTVQEGKQFSCTCKETANTFILPNTTLFYGAATVSSAFQQLIVNVTAKRNISELVCQAELPDGTKASKTQTVQVYYGPSNVSLSVIYNQTENDVISLCDRSLTVTVTCRASDVSPRVNYQFYSNLTDTPSALSNMSAVNYTVTSGGLFDFLCTGNNSLDSSLSATSTHKIIQVTAPPSPPVLEKCQDGGTSFIDAGNQLAVQEGVTRIRCRVEGGYPSVSGLQLECGSQINTTKDNNVLYTDVNITRHMDGSNCSCTATHRSACYRNNKAQTVLDVHFGPTIFIVEANYNSGQTILEKNSGVSISCLAEGNPSPSLSLKMDGREIQPFNVSTHKSNRTLTYHKVMADCMDTGVYTCHAETGQAATNKTVAVYVKCAQQFRYPDSLSQSFQEQVNGTVLINVPIFGYPEPNVTLTSDKYTLVSESYNLNYTKQEPPYGTVSLVINIRNARFFQNYSLNINNSEGALIYSFEVMKGDPVKPGSEQGDSPSLDVGAIVGGIVASVLVIIIIFIIVYLVKRKGAPCRSKKDLYANNSMHTIYENDESANNRADKADIDSRDIKGSRRVSEDIPEAQAQEDPHYEEIIDFRSDMPEKSVYYVNQISYALDGEVEYENTVIGL